MKDLKAIRLETGPQPIKNDIRPPSDFECDTSKSDGALFVPIRLTNGLAVYRKSKPETTQADSNWKNQFL